MDIEEVRKRKYELEAEIYNLLYNFEEVTDALVTDINLTRMEIMSGESKIFNVKLDLQL